MISSVLLLSAGMAPTPLLDDSGQGKRGKEKDKHFQNATFNYLVNETNVCVFTRETVRFSLLLEILEIENGIRLRQTERTIPEVGVINIFPLLISRHVETNSFYVSHFLFIVL